MISKPKLFISGLLISTGIIWLNHYLEFFSIESIEFFKYWPLYLIIFGLNLLPINKILKLIFAFLTGILTILIIYSGIIYFNDLTDEEQKNLEQKIEKKLEDVFDDRNEKI